MRRERHTRWYLEATPDAIGVDVDAIIADAIGATESARCDALRDESGRERRVWECSSWSLADRIRNDSTVRGSVRLWSQEGNGPLRPAPDFRELHERAKILRKIKRGSDLVRVSV